MIKGLIHWLKETTEKITGKKADDLLAQATIVIHRRRRPPEPRKSLSDKTQVYMNDPSTPDLVAEKIVPEKTTFPMQAVGNYGGGYPLGSVQNQAAGCVVTINDALNYLLGKFERTPKGWAATNTLVIFPRAGKDINAYYDRNALKFFYFPDPVAKKMIYACESADVVSHEFGHAFLDAIRPDFWSKQAIEIWAFHEAFGDMVAILCAMQHDQILDKALAETGGDLSKSNTISRLAEEMGLGLYHYTKGEGGELPNTLRDAVNQFVYTQPERLPAKGRDDQLLNEPHSFSRVFTAAFYDIMVGIYNQNVKEGMAPKAALVSARDTSAYYLLHSIPYVPATPRLFDAVARQMLHVDKANNKKYEDVMSKVFTDRKLLIEKVMMLSGVTYDDFAKEAANAEVVDFGAGKVARINATRTIRLADHLGDNLAALGDNPLFNLKVDVPVQSSYYFDEGGNMVDAVEASEAEVIDAAFVCLQHLHQENLVGKHDKALFETKFGKLVRKQIVCKCNRPNYCDPNAPEYGKPWKPRNNAGCVACHQNCDPLPCDCEPAETPTPPKLGCFARVRSGMIRNYRTGGGTSRRVC